MIRKYLTPLLVIAAVSLVLNILWENVQAPWYMGYAGPVAHLPMCMRAAIGDVLIVLLIYGLFALMYKDMWWFQKLDWRSVVLLAVVGSSIGIGIEKLALSAQRWDYAQSMPIIPIVEVGLTPVLQMMLLPIVTFYLTSKYISRA